MDTTTKPTDPQEIEKLEAVLELPEDAELIDETFYVWETRFGLFSTMTQDGRKMLTGGVKDNVIMMTRWNLKCEQEGWPEGSVRVVGSAIVDGKL